MREIKFRFWDSRNKRMLYAGIYDLDTVGNDGISFLDDEDEYNWIIMLYTGYKDKNGKEIYEEDIYITSRDSSPSVVDFAYFHYQIIEFSLESHDFEVLGNINENLKLMEIEK
jgi:hypothetical protein